MAEPSDSELLQAWRAGDRQAGTTLLRRHFLSVYRYFAGNVGAEAEELTQRTFEAAVASRDRIHDDEAFRAHLFGIARNQLRRHIASVVKRRDLVPPSQAGITDGRTSPSRAVARNQEQRLVHEALESVPIEFRAVLRRFYWEERSVADIARELGIATGTVKSRLARGRKFLREQIDAMEGDDDTRAALLARIDAEPEA